MTTTPKTPRLFTVRLWQEETGEDQAEWRGKVQALPGGEAYYFRDWSGLIGRLETMLAGESALSDELSRDSNSSRTPSGR